MRPSTPASMSNCQDNVRHNAAAHLIHSSSCNSRIRELLHIARRPALLASLVPARNVFTVQRLRRAHLVQICWATIAGCMQVQRENSGQLGHGEQQRRHFQLCVEARGPDRVPADQRRRAVRPRIAVLGTCLHGKPLIASVTDEKLRLLVPCCRH